MSKPKSASDSKRLTEAMQSAVQEMVSSGSGDSSSNSTEESLGLGIRGALERGWLGSLGPVVEEARKHNAQEIERVCSRHSEGLLGSLKDLMGLKKSTDSLTSGVRRVAATTATAGKTLLSEAQQCSDMRDVKARLSKVCAVLKLCQNISRKVAETATLLAQSKADLHETLECYRCVAALLGLLKATCKSSGSSSSGEGGVRYIVEVEQWLSKAKRGLLERCRDLAAGFIRGLPADELEIGEAMLHHELDLLMPRQAGSGAAGATGNITSTGGSPDAVSARSPSGSWSGVMGDVEPAALSLRHVLVVHREAFRAAAWVSAWPEKVAVLPMVCSEHEAHVSEGAVPGLIAVRGSLRALHCAAHICKALGEPTYLGETYRTLRVPVLARMARSYSPEDSLDTREAEAAEGALDEAVREKGLCTVLEQLCARLCGAFVVEGMILMLVSQTLQATAPVPVVQATPLLSVAAGVSDDGVHGGCEKDRSGRLLQLAELQDLWCLCRDDVRALLLRNIDALKSPEDVLRVKECLLLTSEAAGEHGDVYREVPLTSMLAIVVTRFVTLQSEDLAATTTAALHAAGFLAMVVDSHEVFSSSVTALGLSKLEFEGADPFGQTGGSSWECGSSGSGLAPSSRRITANSLSPASSSMSRAGMGGRRGTFRRASRLRQAGSVSAILGSVGVGAGGKRSVRSRLGDLRSISCDAVDGEDEVGAIRVMQSVDDHFTSLSGPSVLTGEAGSGARDQNRGGGGGGGSGGGGGGGGGGAALGLMSPMTTGRRFKAINDEQTSMLDSLEDDLLRVDSSETGDDGRPESSLSNISVGSGHSGERGHGSSFDDTSSIASHSSVGTSSRRSRRTFVARKFSFSAAVPAVLKRIYISVARCFALMARVPGLAGDGEFGGRGVLTSLQQCLVAVGKALKEDLECDGADTPLVKACQISVDANALAYGLSSVRETVLQCLDEHALHHVSDEEVDAAMDPGMRVLEEVANTSKEIALELLTGKVDMLTESLCFIDWQGSSSEAGPHDVVSSVTEFLTVTMASLSQMPRPAVESIHFAVCARISRNFLEFIMAERKDAPIQIGMVCWLRIDKDVRVLESFADACGVSQLRLCFKELREYTSAMLSPDLLSLAGQATRRTAAFPAVDPTKLAGLLRKTSPMPRGRALPPSMPKRDTAESTAIIKLLLTPSRK